MKILKSIGYAFNGIKAGIYSEVNYRVQIVIALSTMAMGFLFQLTKTEWLLVLLSMGMVLCMELMNSALEKLCDVVHPEFHLQIKKIKDMAAGAVLTVSVTSIIIGIIIFLPKFFTFLKSIVL